MPTNTTTIYERLLQEWKARPPFASTDAGLIAAEQEIAALRKKQADLRAAGDDGDHDEIGDRAMALETWIAQTAPDTMIGAAVKLRRLADESGLEAGAGHGDVESVRQVLAVVERELASGGGA